MCWRQDTESLENKILLFVGMVPRFKTSTDPCVSPCSLNWARLHLCQSIAIALVPSMVAAVVEVFEPLEFSDSFGVTRIRWDATLLEDVLTHLWDGGIHSSLLLDPF